MKTKLALAVVALASFVAPAMADDPAPAKQSVCLRHMDVDGWGSRDDHSMIVNDRFGKKYLVSLAGICNDLDFAFGAGFRPLGGTAFAGSCVDRGDHVVMRGGGASRMDNSCWVTKVQPYTKDMAAADKLARANKQPLAQY